MAAVVQTLNAVVVMKLFKKKDELPESFDEFGDAGNNSSVEDGNLYPNALAGNAGPLNYFEDERLQSANPHVPRTFES